MQRFYLAPDLRKIDVEIDTTHVEACTHYLFDGGSRKLPDPFQYLLLLRCGFVFRQQVDGIIEVTGITVGRFGRRQALSIRSLNRTIRRLRV